MPDLKSAYHVSVVSVIIKQRGSGGINKIFFLKKAVKEILRAL